MACELPAASGVPLSRWSSAELAREAIGRGIVEQISGVMARRLELARLLDRAPSRERQLCLAMLVERVLRPASKLATARGLADSTLAAELDVEGVDEDDLYRALDWLAERQQGIERRLARRHLRPGEHALYDVSSSLRERFGLKRLVLCVDRGMVTEANLDAIGQAGFAFISALRAPQVKRLARQGTLQLSLLDELDLAEIESDDFPGERLVVCRNPLVGQERSRKRQALLAATEVALEAIAARVERGTLRGEAEIGLAVGAVWNRHRVKKHFRIEISDATLRFERREAEITAEAALDGIYILRTTVPPEQLEAADVVRSYKQLAQVERAHRSLKGPDLELRPIHHRLEERVRAHVFLCTLAYYLEWHLRYAWRELLYADEQPPLADDPVAPQRRSPEAARKAQRKRTAAGKPCHSWPTLLRHLALRCRNTIRLAGAGIVFDRLTEPTPAQARALELVQTAELPP